ncbi:helix-turn-helix domain-containing protein [Nocardia cyriacigeorgica]|uniref:helix-turn-helix domain-containing protein n=1 Tax=Nocardia cyriacigeorgica TaxID=135487 RepID=UPI001895427E|nr:helix-turn-helix domain-containing protein [Nocardia cyriacigeorgica]MBF6315755.1 helix-turn-helix domain-containing protein [Nocardia cyriacigeorgica]MBF6530540.1 helix-turn-helix domain-containing protein [Nocardia cyriacigeorgica]
MAQQPRELAAMESAQQFFGAELRHWRLLRRLSLERLGSLSHDSGSLIGKVEKTQRRPTRDFAQRMDKALDTGGVLDRMWLDMNPPVVQSESRVSLVEGNDSTQWLGLDECDPVREWLDETIPAFSAGESPRRVGAADIAVMWSMCDVFANTDHHLGGGYARSTLARFLDDVVKPALHGTYDSRTGRDLYAVAARLCDLSGFMCFDSARQGLGQRYLRHALRLAKASGNAALGAHILTDMSMQAHYLRRAPEAIWFGSAAVRAAEQSGSPSTTARCNALLARAHALDGDTHASAQAMAEAERQLNRARPDDEPDWIRFFTDRQLSAEFMYAAHDAGRTRDVQQWAPAVLADSVGMERRHVLAASTLAGSFVPDSGDGSDCAPVDVEQACRVLADTMVAARGLTSARGIEAINDVRRRLAPYAEMAVVKEVEHEFRSTVALIG